MKKHDIKLGLMSPFIRASAYALTESPVVNAGKNSIYKLDKDPFQSSMRTKLSTATLLICPLLSLPPKVSLYLSSAMSSP